MRENQPTIADFEDREGAVSRGMPVASESWKGQEDSSLPEPPEGMQSQRHLDFSPGRLISDFWPPEL